VQSTAVKNSSYQQQVLVKLELELQAKIMKAHIEYNKALLADATNNKTTQQQQQQN